MKKEVNKAQDPGLGSSYQKKVTRILNENGTFNIKRIGTVEGFRDFYKYLIDLSMWRFILSLFIGFLTLNTLFALAYYFIGTEYLTGLSKNVHPFMTCFYFSAQTFTTVGYGAISPIGTATSLLAAFEAFVGLIAFSIATGLIYGRFSRPSSKIAFTHNILLTDYKDGKALMFKMVNLRNSVLLNSKINVMASLGDDKNDSGTYLRSYYTLNLEVDFVRYFPLTWTIVHPIDDESPFNGLDIEDILKRGSEILIILEAFDETFSQRVLQKHSYAQHQWKDGFKFKRNFHSNEAGEIVLNIHELNELEPI